MQMKLSLLAAALFVHVGCTRAALLGLHKRAPMCDEAIGTDCNFFDVDGCRDALAASGLSEDEDGRQTCSGVISATNVECSCSCDCGASGAFNSLGDFNDLFDGLANSCILDADGHPGSDTYQGTIGGLISCSLS
ncbi:unnamed protein product [Somion occarium]|uniref:Uncharacterized protein n=1 Tax=Somion occarium TaxID=3059160 RepID=A0ABP1E3B8_9APHY